MTRSSIREYTEAVRGRYIQASKKEKGKILDEFTKVIGCHRKAAIRLLHRGNQPMANKKSGRPRQYGATVARALRVACLRVLSLSEPLPTGRRTVLARLGELTWCLTVVTAVRASI